MSIDEIISAYVSACEEEKRAKKRADEMKKIIVSKNKMLAGDILEFYSGHCMVIGYNSRRTYFNSLASPDISPDCMALVLKKIDIRSDVMILYVEDSGEE